MGNGNASNVMSFRLSVGTPESVRLTFAFHLSAHTLSLSPLPLLENACFAHGSVLKLFDLFSLSFLPLIMAVYGAISDGILERHTSPMFVCF